MLLSRLFSDPSVYVVRNLSMETITILFEDIFPKFHSTSVKVMERDQLSIKSMFALACMLTPTEPSFFRIIRITV